MLEHFNLSWKTFPVHLESTIKELYHEQRFTDLSLVSDDQVVFRAHRIILRACSPVFRNIIDNHPGTHTLIYLRGIHSQEIQSILEFIYQGEAMISYDRLSEFFKVSQDLKVKEINIGLSSALVAPSDKATDSDHQVSEEHIQTKGYHSSGSEDMMDTVSVDISNVDTASVDISNVDTASVDISNVDTGRVDVSNVDTSSVDISNVDSSNVDASSVDTINVDFISVDVEHELDKNETEDVRKEEPANSNLGHKTYPCNRCVYQAVGLSDIKEHILSQHKKTFCCPYCDYKTDTPRYLRIHTEGQHEGIRYPCNQCDYQATQRGNLRRHIQIVHEQVKYPCYHCNIQYKDKRSLKRHILTYHKQI